MWCNPRCFLIIFYLWMYFKLFKIGQIYAFLKVIRDKLWIGIRPLLEYFIWVSRGREESHRKEYTGPLHWPCLLFKFKNPYCYVGNLFLFYNLSLKIFIFFKNYQSVNNQPSRKQSFILNYMQLCFYLD